MSRRSLSKGQRIDVLAAASGVCHICGDRINPVRERWEVEHVIPLALGGSDDVENMRPAHRACHAGKTRRDVGVIAKAKRVAQKHAGTFRPARHKLPPSRPLPGTKASGLRKKLNGSFEPHPTRTR
ncbi:HNH endonuclease [Frigidibacter oleivorans]|uniref:HNH endonuclease n=1 Tax=Frigidibacter oleivorans TaxID=2487129 RepID=UPI000F8D2308|nr:HNH endonuclease signature motif containing protein [Frigidibacter oleivorans]